MLTDCYIFAVIACRIFTQYAGVDENGDNGEQENDLVLLKKNLKNVGCNSNKQSSVLQNFHTGIERLFTK